MKMRLKDNILESNPDEEEENVLLEFCTATGIFIIIMYTYIMTIFSTVV